MSNLKMFIMANLFVSSVICCVIPPPIDPVTWGIVSIVHKQN